MHEIIYLTLAAVVTALLTWLATHRQRMKSHTSTAFRFAIQQSTALQNRVDRQEQDKQELNTTVLNQSRQLDDLARRLDEEYNPTRAVSSAYRHLPFSVWITNTNWHVVFVNLYYEQQ